MNAQEIFDTVALHLIRQGKPALNSEGECCYRGDYGEMCAVGCLIPDDIYSVEMEGRTVGQLLEHDHFSEVLPSYFSMHQHLLDRLQTAHDSYFWNLGFAGFIEKMIEIAKDFDLKPDVLFSK